MKTYIPLDRLKRSRDSGSALYNMHPTDVLGRAGGGYSAAGIPFHKVVPAFHFRV